jgi:hypothetical protein
MVDNQENNDPEVEDQQVVQRVAEEIIEPALQKALAEARKTATAQESLSALATCYGALLVDLMGKRACHHPPIQRLCNRINPSYVIMELQVP